MLQTILGIDVAKDKFDVILFQDGNVQYSMFDNHHEGYRALSVWLNNHSTRPVHACMEATGYYELELAAFLSQAGHTVSVVNPLRVKSFGKSLLLRNKTDKSDAWLIAEFCRMYNPPPWSPPDLVWHELKMLCHHLEDLKAMRQQERNRLQACGVPDTLQDLLQQHITFLEAQIQEVQNQIFGLVDSTPFFKHQKELLVSIPGIADLTAAKILAEFRCIDDFNDPRQLVAYAGLNPRQHSSGSSVRGRTPISKTGNAVLRKALYFPAIVAKQHNPIIRAFCLRLLERGKAPKAVIVAAMRKLLHLIYGILKSGKPFDPHYQDKQVMLA